MASKYRIRLGGTGGQGIIKLAMVLAEAAIIDGNNATQTQVYGPESRGGATKAEVNISQERILFPLVTDPNIVLCLSDGSLKAFTGDIVNGGTLIVDSSLELSKEYLGVTIHKLPIIKQTYDEFGNGLSTNIVALGVLNAICKLVSDQAVESSLKQGFKKEFFDANLKAYYLGVKLVGQYL